MYSAPCLGRRSGARPGRSARPGQARPGMYKHVRGAAEFENALRTGRLVLELVRGEGGSFGAWTMSDGQRVF